MPKRSRPSEADPRADRRDARQKHADNVGLLDWAHGSAQKELIDEKKAHTDTKTKLSHALDTAIAYKANATLALLV